MSDDTGADDKHDSKVPNLELAEWKYLVAHPAFEGNKAELTQKILAVIKEMDMTPFYKECCAELNWTLDDALVDKMAAANEAKLKQLEDTIVDAEQNLGETEVKDALYKKAEYLCQIGDKAACLSAFRLAFDKTVGVGHQLDLVFQLIRIGLFYLDHSVITANISKAKELMERGGDWDRKNRLKAYEGLYALSIRDFKTAANQFLDCISTFTSNELMTYDKLVFYTVVTSLLTLERSVVKDKLIRGAEIQEQLYSSPNVKAYINSLYDCDYSTFFSQLANIEQQLKFDRLFAPHYSYYVRAMRVLAYKQVLASYRSLTLDYMAKAFGVTKAFIDKELHQLIASGALHCKIDRVKGIVETDQLDSKNYQYQSVIKHGDILLSRVQKLSRVINM